MNYILSTQEESVVRLFAYQKATFLQDIFNARIRLSLKHLENIMLNRFRNQLLIASFVAASSIQLIVALPANAASRSCSMAYSYGTITVTAPTYSANGPIYRDNYNRLVATGLVQKYTNSYIAYSAQQYRYSSTGPWYTYISKSCTINTA